MVNGEMYMDPTYPHKPFEYAVAATLGTAGYSIMYPEIEFTAREYSLNETRKLAAVIKFISSTGAGPMICIHYKTSGDPDYRFATTLPWASMDADNYEIFYETNTMPFRFGIQLKRDVVRKNTSTAVGANDITLDAGASAVDGEYTGSYIHIKDGKGLDQVRKIFNYVGSTKVATVKSWANWGTKETPDAVSAFEIYDQPLGRSDTLDIKGFDILSQQWIRMADANGDIWEFEIEGKSPLPEEEGEWDVLRGVRDRDYGYRLYADDSTKVYKIDHAIDPTTMDQTAIDGITIAPFRPSTIATQIVAVSQIQNRTMLILSTRRIYFSSFAPNDMLFMSGVDPTDGFWYELKPHEGKEILWALGMQLPVLGGPKGIYTFFQKDTLVPGSAPYLITQSAIDPSYTSGPALMNELLLYVQKNGKGLRAVQYNQEVDKFEASLLNTHAEHIFGTFKSDGIKALTVITDPFSMLICLLNDGTIAQYTYNPALGISAWSRWEVENGRIDTICFSRDANNNPIFVMGVFYRKDGSYHTLVSDLLGQQDRAYRYQGHIDFGGLWDGGDPVVSDNQESFGSRLAYVGNTAFAPIITDPRGQLDEFRYWRIIESAEDHDTEDDELGKLAAKAFWARLKTDYGDVAGYSEQMYFEICRPYRELAADISAHIPSLTMYFNFSRADGSGNVNFRNEISDSDGKQYKIQDTGLARSPIYFGSKEAYGSVIDGCLWYGDEAGACRRTGSAYEPTGHVVVSIWVKPVEYGSSTSDRKIWGGAPVDNNGGITIMVQNAFAGASKESDLYVYAAYGTGYLTVNINDILLADVWNHIVVDAEPGVALTVYCRTASATISAAAAASWSWSSVSTYDSVGGDDIWKALTGFYDELRMWALSDPAGRPFTREHLLFILNDCRHFMHLETQSDGLSGLKALVGYDFDTLDTGTAERSGEMQSWGSGVVTLDTGASAVDDYYNGMIITFSFDICPPYVTEPYTVEHTITDYDGTTKVCTLDPVLPSTLDGFDCHIGDPILNPAFAIRKADTLVDRTATDAAGFNASISNKGTLVPWSARQLVGYSANFVTPNVSDKYGLDMDLGYVKVGETASYTLPTGSFTIMWMMACGGMTNQVDPIDWHIFGGKAGVNSGGVSCVLNFGTLPDEKKFTIGLGSSGGNWTTQTDDLQSSVWGTYGFDDYALFAISYDNATGWVSFFINDRCLHTAQSTIYAGAGAGLQAIDWSTYELRFGGAGYASDVSFKDTVVGIASVIDNIFITEQVWHWGHVKDFWAHISSINDVVWPLKPNAYTAGVGNLAGTYGGTGRADQWIKVENINNAVNDVPLLSSDDMETVVDGEVSTAPYMDDFYQVSVLFQDSNGYDEYGNKLYAGEKMRSWFRTMPIPHSQGIVKRVLRLFFTLLNSNGVQAGNDLWNMDTLTWDDVEQIGYENKGTAGTQLMTYPGSFTEHGSVYVAQLNGLPMTVLQAMYEFEEGD
jgi:hypothetical protein